MQHTNVNAHSIALLAGLYMTMMTRRLPTAISPPFASISSYRPIPNYSKTSEWIEIRRGLISKLLSVKPRPALNLIQKVVINSRYHQTALKPDIGGRINRWWIVEIILKYQPSRSVPIWEWFSRQWKRTIKLLCGSQDKFSSGSNKESPTNWGRKCHGGGKGGSC